MKRFNLLLFLLPMLAACTRSDYSRRLAAVDSLLYVRPDSALTLLRSIPPSRLHTEEERMRYALFSVEAECRNRIPQRNDSLIGALVDYYQSYGDDSMLARAYYGLGIVNNGLNRENAAMTAFLSSERYARRAKNTKLLGRIYGNLGYLYQTNDMAAEADSMYHQSEQMARLSQDSVMLAEALTRQGMYLMEMGKAHYLQAKRLLQEAYHINCGTGFLERTTAISLSVLCQLLQQPDSAVYYARRAVDLCRMDTSSFHRSQYFLGNAFYRCGQTDSAFFYYKQCLHSVDPNVKAGSYQMLAEIAEKEGNWKLALQLKDSLSKYQALHENQKEPEKIVVAGKNAEIYWYKRLWQESRRFIRYVVGMVFSMVIIFFLIRLLYKRADEGQMIPQPHLLPSNSKADDIQVIQELENYTEEDFVRFKQCIRQTALWKKMECIVRYKEDHPYKLSVDKITMADQSAYLEEVRLILPDYLNRLHRRYPSLEEKEDFKLCLYLSGMSVIHMGYVMERKRDTVYKQLQAIKKKMLLDGKTDLMKVLHSV